MHVTAIFSVNGRNTYKRVFEVSSIGPHTPHMVNTVFSKTKSKCKDHADCLPHTKGIGSSISTVQL